MNTFGQYYEAIQVINLDQSTDRLQIIEAQLQHNKPDCFHINDTALRQRIRKRVELQNRRH